MKLVITECREGTKEEIELSDRRIADLTIQVKHWIRSLEMFKLSGEIMSGLDGDYYAELFIDGRLWEAGGFYLEEK